MLGVPTAELEERQLTVRLMTVLGEGLIIHPRSRAQLDQSYRAVSDTVVANALYQQDSMPVLAEHGFTRLRPGRGIYRAINNAKGITCPLLGQVTSKGYSRAHIKSIVTKIEIDLMTRQAVLVVLCPIEPPKLVHQQLVLIRAEPKWSGSSPGTWQATRVR